MQELILATRIALANSFVMYFKAQSYHWNVEGILFSQYHDFFGKVYQNVYESIDPLAEQIRALDSYAPISLVELYEHKTIKEDSSRLVLVRDMLSSLQEANEETLASLNKVFDLASKEKVQGLADYVAGRIDEHSKLSWMIKSSIKRIED